MTTIDLSVVASSDDANEDGAGNVSLTGTTMNIKEFGDRHIGVRFTGANIPNGSTIDVANLAFEITFGDDDPYVTIHAELTNAPGTYTTAANDITGRTYTTASATWEVDNAGNGSINTVSLVALVQEVVDLPGWQSGDDIAFKLSYIDNTGSVTVFSFDGTGAAPALHVEFSEGGSPPTAQNWFPVRR